MDQSQEPDHPRESLCLPRESSCIPRESSCIPRESSCIPRDSSCVPRDSSCVPREESSFREMESSCSLESAEVVVLRRFSEMPTPFDASSSAFFDGRDSRNDLDTSAPGTQSTGTPIQKRSRSRDEEKGTPVSDATSQTPSLSVNEMSRVQEVLFVATVCMAQLCTQAGLGQTLSIIHVIGDSYGLRNSSDLAWVIAGYTLTIGTFIIIAGRLGDVYGYKLIFLSGFIWSALWAAVAGVAVFGPFALLAVSRVLQGIGAALCLPNAIALLGVTYAPGRKRSIIFALIVATAPTGSILGALGSSLLALVWWPIAYWVLAAVSCLVAVVGYFVVPSVDNGCESPQNLEAAVKDLDIPGAVTGVSALVLINFVFIQGPITGWTEPSVWIALIVGVLMAFAFIVIECCYAPSPIIPLSALNTNVSFVLGAIACGWSCFGIWSFYTWQFLQVIRGLSLLIATAWFSPIVPAGIIASVTTGLMLHKLGPLIVMTISMVAFVIGTALMATCPQDQIYWAQTFVCMLVIPWGMDMSLPAAAMLLSDSVGERHQGLVASLVATVVNYSISVGIGLGATVERQVTGAADTRAAILKGYRAALWMSTGLAGLGVVICLAFVLNVIRKARMARQTGQNGSCHSGWCFGLHPKPPVYCRGDA